MVIHAPVIWSVCAAAIAGVVLRPRGWPEAIWALAGAVLLVGAALIPIDAALDAIGKGTDVYLFLIGMMLLSEAARTEGLFDRIAALAVGHARGSPVRLFTLVYLAGVVVTTFLSNDATAVVLTPAVYAAARRAEAPTLPPLFACAMIANAASFVLPISNPANLVLYGGHMPALGPWLAAFALPSVASIIVTYAMLRLALRSALVGSCVDRVEATPLSAGGKAAVGGIVVTVVVLLAASALDRPLGLPTLVAGIATVAAVGLARRRPPTAIVTGISWSVLPLVAGLFVLVEALTLTGVTGAVAELIARGSARDPHATAAMAGSVLAFGSNLANNLPAGLLTSLAIAQAHPPQVVVDALLIGVDLGPNLSITGSLATILWLQAIRREGGDVGFWPFLKVGAIVMPPALAAAIGMRLLIG